MVGTVLGGRYRIQQRIGGGGMALVYRAEDLRLGIPVAVKVLRTQFGGDEDFIRRFRREAHAAASLSHPSVVSIYDVGEEEDHYYIVMELVEGRTLKALIQETGPLLISEAARIAVEILGALSHAHENGIVHRDIKPHNILIASDGRVKVTDFGIARATSTDTVTHTGGALMGSAHYFSPEQASSLPADEKSDLYSVGVVLYEMVTGTVPFQGDNPVSVALKHVRERVVPPSRLNSDVPRELEEIVLQAMAKEPEARFDSAAEMQRAVRQFAADFAAGRTHAAVDDSPTMDLREVRTRNDGRGVRRRGAPTEEEDEVDEEDEPPRRNWAWVWVVVIAMVVMAGAGAAVYAFLNFIDVPNVVVPDVRNMDITTAQETLSQAGLRAQVRSSEPSDLPPNHVIRTHPEPSEEVKQGRVVDLVISRGPEARILPNLAGISLVQARVTLEREGFQVGIIEYKHDRQPENIVLETRPAARTPLPPGATVDLIVSSGPLRVPNLIGRTLRDAQAELSKLGLAVGRTEYRPDPLQPRDTVLATDPPAGSEVVLGQPVNLVLAEGPEAQKASQASVTVEVRGAHAGQFVQLEVILVDEVQGSPRETRIYAQQHQVGDRIPLTVAWYGEGFLKVMTNGALTYTIPLGSAPTVHE
jgi:eukaryotic-like serine/threonine-protein kinase